ncbi:ferrous iron transport protein B [Stratiformator vulcanicus]|uniref:Ferrous iron transport protein B n=1 Tax=Stratiformator vulcanicus TaxID=2527980 RepID=A0A517QVY2_9PLAN|nr:ferrous iron transport protein B [Stratiformator vulcanicus]QDT35791.1 Ferrous iron transport protein B [Stratiformator vulcanicus]
MSLADASTGTTPKSTSRDHLTVALIGNPNTGKSTLFSALSGLRVRTGNFPGCTVEKKVGRAKFGSQEVLLVDLPGTYSLSPRTPDEMVSVDVLLGRQNDVPHLDAIVCIVDASNLERNLYLFSQLRDLGRPIVLVLNMADAARDRGISIDLKLLSEKLSVPVVLTEAHRRKGLDKLKDAIQEAAGADATPMPRVFPEKFYRAVEQLRALCSENGRELPVFLLERLLLDVGGEAERVVGSKIDGLDEKLSELRCQLAEHGVKVPATEAISRYAWIRDTLEGVVTRSAETHTTFSDRVDQFLTHRVFGLLAFAALMFGVFYAIYSGAGPLMDLMEAGPAWLAEQVEAVMGPGALRSLINDGILAGVGGVIVFVPQIAILFLFIALLEDCGYMARAAFLMDRLMRPLGLSGKSFLPLMSSYACAIPGVMATRVIEDRRDRMVTILIAPLMSCSARLPVYILLTSLFVAGTFQQAVVMFVMYSLGLIVAIPVAWTLKKTWFKGEAAPFVMELPSYKWPSWRIVFWNVYDRVKAFVVRAGTLIFATTIVVWALAYFPGDHRPLNTLHQAESMLSENRRPKGIQFPGQDWSLYAEVTKSSNTIPEEYEAVQAAIPREEARLIRISFLGRAGHLIEPIVRPLGWDWKIGVGALASFPAREVIIATLGTIYSLGGDVDEEDEGLRATMRNATHPDGTPVYTAPVALSVMVFFALCAQCAATLMVIYRETNHWFWPVFTFTYMTTLAYIGALITYQIGSLIV